MLLKGDKNYAGGNSCVQYVSMLVYTGINCPHSYWSRWAGVRGRMGGGRGRRGWVSGVGWWVTQEDGRQWSRTCPVNDQNCYLSMIQNYPDCGWGEEEEQRRGEESDSVNHTAGSTGTELCVRELQ